MKSLAILVAEDEVLTRLDIRGMLERAGHVVCGECGNGRKAVELARQLLPDLALLDIMMPELDGIETAKILHGMNIPAVMLTAYSQPHIINRAENVHVCGYLVKPVSPVNLFPAIEIAISQFKRQEEAAHQLDELNEQMETRKVVEQAKGYLMELYHISEQEAYRRLQQYSMKKRKSLKSVALAVIASAKQLK